MSLWYCWRISSNCFQYSWKADPIQKSLMDVCNNFIKIISMQSIIFKKCKYKARTGKLCPPEDDNVPYDLAVAPHTPWGMQWFEIELIFISNLHVLVMYSHFTYAAFICNPLDGLNCPLPQIDVGFLTSSAWESGHIGRHRHGRRNWYRWSHAGAEWTFSSVWPVA